jgi:hypothetical protein
MGVPRSKTKNTKTVRTVDLQKDLDNALKKKAACIRQLEDENMQLSIYNETVVKCEGQLKAAINEYVKAYTSDITEAEINAANLQAKATEILEKGEKEVVWLERLAAQILNSRNNGVIKYQRMRRDGKRNSTKRS